MTLSIISNLSRLATIRLAGVDIKFYLYSTQRAGSVLSCFIRSFRYDYIVLNGSLHNALMLAFLKWIFPFNRTKIVIVDFLLATPVGRKDSIKARLIALLLRKVSVMILYYKNTQGLQKYYRIPPEKFRYVPFKINQYELIQQVQPKDEGYIFCGGKTRRDFPTLFEAIKDLGYPVKVVTTHNDDIAQHGSYLNDQLAPANVEIVRLDGGPEAFISYMASARIVVLPIKPDICGAGIGVYIMAMALKKCVIISSGPGAEDILSPDQAIIVPPGDSLSLRKAIVKAFSDSVYRSIFERNGYKYAMGLQGEERLLQSIVSELQADFMS